MSGHYSAFTLNNEVAAPAVPVPTVLLTGPVPVHVMSRIPGPALDHAILREAMTEILLAG
jgi:hypothetical protein